MKYPTFQGVKSMYSLKFHITKSAFFDIFDKILFGLERKSVKYVFTKDFWSFIV